MLDRGSEMRGFLVVSRKEGDQQGIVSGLHIDTGTKRVAAYRYRRRKRIGTDEYFVPVEQVESVGRDVVTITSEEVATKCSEHAPAPGRSLKDLQGAWVTTMDGNHLGTLVDLEFESTQWGITDLFLADDKRLPVRRDEIEIGDEILVPVGYRELVTDVDEGTPGFLRRAFGREALEDVKRALGRALRRKQKTEETEKEETVGA
jgi:sporulation protein YlmC with PRC-barrel domain